MSLRTKPHTTASAPEGARKKAQARFPAMMLGAMAGAGILLWLPGQARADRDGISYGHAEITLGFPHGQVTVGRTWDDHPRRVVVEEEVVAEAPERVIVEERHCPPPPEVTVIERYPEPVRVVREVYVERPSCGRPEVVVYGGGPRRVIYAPARTVIVSPRGGGRYHDGGGFRHDHEGYRERDRHGQGGRGGYGDSGDHRNSGDHGRSDGGGHGYQGGDKGPRDLFPQDHDRPAR
jgi:hypothetical protein